MNNLVSIIVPVYNVEQYITTCLDSIFNQNYSNLELIIIDDCSTDNTINLIKNYIQSKNHFSTHIISNETNKGPGTSRNIGVQHANGDFICFVDGDDVLDPYFIKNLVKYLNDPNVDIAIGKDIWFNDGDDISYMSKPANHEVREVYGDKILYYDLPVMVWGRIYRKSIFLDNNIKFDDLLHEDEIVSFSTTYASDKIILCNNAFYYYRQRKGSRQDERTDPAYEYAKNYLKTIERLIELNNNQSNYNIIKTHVKNNIHFIKMIYWTLKKINKSSLPLTSKSMLSELYKKFTIKNFGNLHILTAIIKYVTKGNDDIDVIKFKIFYLSRKIMKR